MEKVCVRSKWKLLFYNRNSAGNIWEIFHKKVFFFRSSHRRCFIKKVFLQISQNFKKIPVSESLFEGFFCEFFEAFKNTNFTEHLRATASASSTFANTYDGSLASHLTKVNPLHEMLYVIWWHLYNLKNVKNTSGGVLL